MGSLSSTSGLHDELSAMLPAPHHDWELAALIGLCTTNISSGPDVKLPASIFKKLEGHVSTPDQDSLWLGFF